MAVGEPARTEINRPADVPLTIEPLFAGEYLVSDGNTSRRLFANFFDPSDPISVGPKSSLPLSPAPSIPPSAPATRADLGYSLFGIAIALLLLEWIAATREC